MFLPVERFLFRTKTNSDLFEFTRDKIYELKTITSKPLKKTIN